MYKNFSNCTPLFSPLRSSENALNISDQLESIGQHEMSANTMEDATLHSDFLVVFFFFFFSFGTLKKTLSVSVLSVSVSDTIQHFTWMDTCNLRCRPFFIFWIRLPGPHTSLCEGSYLRAHVAFYFLESSFLASCLSQK